MIWIVGEYADRIDNADELLSSFLEGFQDENTMVYWCCLIVWQIVLVSTIYVYIYYSGPAAVADSYSKVVSKETD